MTQRVFKFISKQFRYSIRFQHVIFPFTASELAGALARTNTGYILAMQPRINMPVGAAFDPVGTIAQKGNSFINFDPAVQILAVEGPDHLQVIEIISEVIDIISAALVPNFERKAVFYEILSNHIIEIGKNSLEILGKYPPSRIDAFISSTIGEEVSNYSIHVATKTGKIDDPNWFDIRIQPYNKRPEVAFDATIVYRKSKKSEVDKFGRALEDNLKKIFEFLPT